MNKTRVVAALQAVAGLAAAAAQDTQDCKFWPGELSSIIYQMRQQLDAASREIGDDK